MKGIKISIDDSCKFCKETLKYFDNLYKRRKGAYMHFTKDFKVIEGIVITPDYNSEGYLTHFHINKATKKFLKDCIKHIEIMEKESESIKKLRKNRK